MPMIRAFIAFDLTPEILRRLEQVSTQLKERLNGIPVRWVPIENIHLTLKFLGDVSMANLDILKQVLQAEASGQRGFEISVGGVGAFPNTHRPRVIWVGVEAPPELFDLQTGIENQMARLGYAREERPFSAHLTLGRVSRNVAPDDVRQIGVMLETTKIGFLGAALMREVHLYKSDLRPDGAIYSRLFSAPLGE